MSRNIDRSIEMDGRADGITGYGACQTRVSPPAPACHNHGRHAVNLILLERTELDSGDITTLRGDRARHLLNVLKVTPGQTVRVGIVDGQLGTGTVTTIAPGEVALRCAFERETLPPPAIDLLLAVPRPKVLRRLWAQLAALGVARIIITNAARVERDYFDTHVLTPECYRPLLSEGLQQARDTRLPRVSVHRQFRKLIEDDLDTLVADALRIVAHPDADVSVPAAVSASTMARVLVAVGPEGGWNAFELSLLESRGFQRVALGPRTLRVDTACVALLGVVSAALEQRPSLDRTG